MTGATVCTATWRQGQLDAEDLALCCDLVTTMIVHLPSFFLEAKRSRYARSQNTAIKSTAATAGSINYKSSISSSSSNNNNSIIIRGPAAVVWCPLEAMSSPVIRTIINNNTTLS